MVCASSVVAHLTKLIVTLGCMKSFGETYRLKGRTWPLRAYQILLAHSVLGILRFGAPFVASASTVAKHFRNFYDWYTRIVEIVPLALFTAGVLNGYGINDRLRIAVLCLGIVPVVFHLITKRKDSLSTKHRVLTNVSASVQLIVITLVGLRNSNYNVVSLAVSYVFERFFVDEFCYYYDIPSIDLTQYSLCFIELFMLLTLNEM